MSNEWTCFYLVVGTFLRFGSCYHVRFSTIIHNTELSKTHHPKLIYMMSMNYYTLHCSGSCGGGQNSDPSIHLSDVVAILLSFLLEEASKLYVLLPINNEKIIIQHYIYPYLWLRVLLGWPRFLIESFLSYQLILLKGVY